MWKAGEDGKVFNAWMNQRGTNPMQIRPSDSVRFQAREFDLAILYCGYHRGHRSYDRAQRPDI